MLLLIDNYDSFVYNLRHYLGELGADERVLRNDAVTVDAAIAMAPEAIVISPGPGYPASAGICLDLIRKAAGRIPLLGVCLGHQAIGEAFGGSVVRAPTPVHGKTSEIHHNASGHNGTGIFAGLPSPFRATRYHSLVVDRTTLPTSLEVTAWTEDGLVMGFAHRDLTIHGVQFHPESIASEHGHRMLGNFLQLAKRRAGHAA